MDGVTSEFRNGTDGFGSPRTRSVSAAVCRSRSTAAAKSSSYDRPGSTAIRARRRLYGQLTAIVASVVFGTVIPSLSSARTRGTRKRIVSTTPSPSSQTIQSPTLNPGSTTRNGPLTRSPIASCPTTPIASVSAATTIADPVRR
jgi:hypothetical protein